MIFSYQWLREWVDPEMESTELMEKLTMAGLEVDGHAAVARRFSGIVVAEVTSVQPHPDADKLSLCEVNDGSQTWQVVCGAPNVEAGMKAPFATVGAEIYPAVQENGGNLKNEEKPFQIKKAKLRGVESQGMLCSREELGLEEKSTGLMRLPADAPVGEDIRDYLRLDDVSIELDLTPNRGDCLGMAGIAREVGVISRQSVNTPDFPAVAPAIDEQFPVKITAAAACPRYLGRVVKGINLDAATPLWMREKLRRSGLRSIDPIVDVTNFVLLELGQPMHAFDLARLEGHINVRMAESGEKLTLLDGKEVELSEDVLVIADAGKAVAMAGIMGGLDTSVTDSTRDVFLECAWFAPLAIAGKARAYGMHTDASHRYERGVDHQIQHQAMERATQLLLEIAGGEAGPITEATGELPKPRQVLLQYASVGRLLGIEMDAEAIIDIFTRLGFGIADQQADHLVVDVPSFRFDITIEADLIEELARIYGYNNIPKTSGQDHIRLGYAEESRLELSTLRRQLVALGYQEIITYSFIDPKLAATVCGDEAGAISLENPISEEMSVMRPSLLPGLLTTAAYNLNRQQSRLRLFETGLVFAGEGDDIRQTAMVGGLITGSKQDNNWINNKEIVDFYDVKGDIESLLMLAGKTQQWQMQPARQSAYHPGQCAAITDAEGDVIGHLGALHPAIQRELELNQPVFVFEVQLSAALSANLPRASALSKYPEVSRDLAIVVDEKTPAGEILAAVRQCAGEFLTDLRIFDVYQGDAVTKNKKSLALGLTWQHPSRTLSDEEINSIIRSCVNALQEQFNANLRD